MTPKQRKKILDREVDYESKESFPASDPPSWTLGSRDSEHTVEPPDDDPS